MVGVLIDNTKQNTHTQEFNSTMQKQALRGNDHILQKQLFLSFSLRHKQALRMSLRGMRSTIEMTCLHVPILATAYPSLNIFHSCSSISLSRRSLFFPVFLLSIPCSMSHLQCFPPVVVMLSSCFHAASRKPGTELKGDEANEGSWGGKKIQKQSGVASEHSDKNKV